MDKTRNRFLWAVIAVVAFGGGYAAWHWLSASPLPPGIASANGRIEATEIDIAAKTPGRLKEVMVDEGDFVTAGQVLARMDTEVLEAQLREAQAHVRRATIAIDTARSQVVQRRAEKQAAVAVIAQRNAELDAAQKRFVRSEQLAKSGSGSIENLDNDRARYEGAKAAVSAAEAQAAAVDSAIGAAQAQVIDAEAAVDATKATVDRIKADIADGTLVAPRDGRVQYRVAQPGEVLGAGGKVLNVVDLSDVYMTFFLSTDAAGRVAIGSEVHLVIDAIPQYVVPARATFVADVAQFTPKTVETAEERQKLMFRIKARIAPDLLRKYVRQVKTGLPGTAYVRLDAGAKWPPQLEARLPQ
ncbi:HlyD family secretion protein [Undibacter mobilis]|uniref:HlyD family efflux transporter periplasmic adaptor subunit n=1 Tax=Undibacter mobilis TaxID=2292256 RepID=A0A371B109_9BRAD|nr:HlyD family efflux transporter periplasmic adaptor subunit [Undibacter mobilis]RDV01230.1 HlyD family efflux transporter periplasmic adaptor subunit [Undibacter mobilis]